jgi:uncharacterized repeat protein (TIGR01451 family)
MVFRCSILVCALALFLFAPAHAQSRARSNEAAYGRLRMHFEENRGQTDPRVRFVARGAGYALFITETETVAVLKKQGSAPAVIRMNLIGASDHQQAEGVQRLDGKSNYLLGSDPAKWRTNVPHFGKVRLSGVYEGIDVVYYGNQGEIEYDFVVAPGSDPRRIRMQFEGAARIDTNSTGDLVLHIPGGEIRQRAPFVYQQRGGSRDPVQAKYRRLGPSEFGFALGAYDPTLPLVIDPVLAWSTYLGGSGQDAAMGIAVDVTGAAYVTGHTASVDFPTANAVQAINAGGFDAFVTKFAVDGTALVYSTYLGGSSGDSGRGIAVDTAGNVYVAGDTNSIDFPTVNAFQPVNGGNTDAFVTKLNATGTALLYSSYHGGTGSDFAFGIDVDSSGNAYVAGSTDSTNFPTTNALQAVYAGSVDAFVAKIDAAGSALVYSTYLGGSLGDLAAGVAVDSAGSAYVAGETSSSNFPTVNAIQSSYGGVLDGFVTKLNADGTAFVYSTFLGGSSADEAAAIAVDDVGNAYTTGSTISTDFPTANALQASGAGSSDVFVSKLNPAGSAFVYSTYLGGSNSELAFAVAAGGSGNAYVAGRTSSTDFPMANASQPVLAGIGDAFATSLNAAGSALVDSTYLGGSAVDEARGIAVDPGSNVYVAGLTVSSNFPTVNAVQAGFAGVQDAFVTKLVETSADVGITKAAAGAFVAGQDGTFTITVSNAGPTAATGVTVTDTIVPAATFVSSTPSQGSCSGTTTVTCTLGTIANGASATITLIVQPTAPGPLSNTATVSSSPADLDAANNTSTAVVDVEPASAATAIPALAGQSLLLLAALLATVAVWMVGRSG